MPELRLVVLALQDKLAYGTTFRPPLPRSSAASPHPHRQLHGHARSRIRPRLRPRRQQPGLPLLPTPSRRLKIAAH